MSCERVVLLDCRTKAEALDRLIDALACSPHVEDRDALAEAILKRERLLSTGVGSGIAFPHAVTPSVRGLVMAVGVCLKPLPDYESSDGKPVRLILMIGAGLAYREQMLHLMTALGNRLKRKERRDR